MALQWSTHGAVALVAALMAVGMGTFVYATRPDRLQNRLLAMAVVLGGLSAGLYFGAPLFATQPGHARAAIGAGVTMMILLAPAYLLFLGTVRTPLTRPFRGPYAFWTLAAYTALLEVAWFTMPDRFLDGLHYYPHVASWHVDPTAAHVGFRMGVLGPLAIVQIYGLLVALSAYRRAGSPGARQKAGAFALAFGTRDLLGVAFIAYFGARSLQIAGASETVFMVAIPVMDLLFYMVLAYGILKTQLFDIDLRLKAVFERGLIATPFAVTYFVATEGLERFVPFDSFWLAVASAGAIVLALRPIRRFAAHLADRLLPGIHATPQYLGTRRQDVYRHAVEAVLEDGRISDAERRVLDRLGHDLGLPDEEITGIEAGMRQLEHA